MKLSPARMKTLLNLYPPYIGAGVKVEHISEDWRSLRVSMRLRWYTRNAVGTHFGGSLYAMVDPHLMLLLMQLLGDDYVVWDKSATIEFVKATRRKVYAVIQVGDEELEEIRRRTEQGDKYLPSFSIEIRDDDGRLVARVEKVLYVRKKRVMPEKARAVPPSSDV